MKTFLQDRQFIKRYFFNPEGVVAYNDLVFPPVTNNIALACSVLMRNMCIYPVICENIIFGLQNKIMLAVYEQVFYFRISINPVCSMMCEPWVLVVVQVAAH